MNKALTVLALTTLAGVAHGSIITQWNYNSVSPDGFVTTGTNSASTGTGLSTSVGTTGSFVSGGGTDSTAADNSAFTVTGFTAATTGSGTRGAQFNGSTAGYWNIGFTWDQRNSATASRYGQLQYTTNGTSWTNASVVDFGTNSSAFVSYALSGFNNATGNNAAFAVRLVSVFAPSSSSYTGVSSTYGTTGTWRFDMATITGTANSAPTGGSHSDNATTGQAPVSIDLATLWGDVNTVFGDVVSLDGSSGPAEFSLSGTMLTFTAPSSIVGTSQTFTFNFGVIDAVGATGAGTVTYTVTPTPGAAALLGLGLVASGRRRRN